MSNLAMEKSVELKKELEARGYDSSSVIIRKKTWTVGVQKNLWQYFDDIEADTREQAIQVALSKVRDGNWNDFYNELEVSDCYETTDEAA